MTHHHDPEAARGIGFPRLYDLLMLVLTRGRERRYREHVLDLAGIRAGVYLLDIGCGTGTLAIAAWRRSRPGGRVAGTDVSDAMLGVARRKARRAGAEIEFRPGDATSLPFDDAQFDVATMTTVMHAVPEAEQGQCIAEARRVLKPGGCLLLVDFGGDVRTRKHWSARHGPHGAFDLDALRELLPQEGFADAETGALDWLSLHFLRAR
jgi:ubiquinone/menaquinone biosynthesis C-methylase UbiE